MPIKQKQIADEPKLLSGGTAPTTGAGTGAFFPLNMGGGQTEAAFVDESGNVTQITNAGALNLGAINLSSINDVPSYPNNGSENILRELNGAISWVAMPSGGSGEANTASNLAGDEGIFASKVGVDLRFKSLKAGTNVSLSSDASSITINATGSGTDANAIHDNVAGEINAIVEKTTPVSTDLLIIEDSEDSNNKKKVQVGNLPGGSSSGVGEEFAVQLGAGSSITEKVNNAPTGGIPSGWTVVDSTNGAVHSQLSGTTDDIVFIHSTGKVCIISAIVIEDVFGGYSHKIPSGADTFNPGDIKTESVNANQTTIKNFNIVVGNAKSWTWLKFLPILT